MFNNVTWTIPDVERKLNPANKFIDVIGEEDRRIKAMRDQDEIQSTPGNPRIRAMNETIDLSEELRSQKKDEFLEKKRRQQLRENTHELRQLQTALQAAYVSKQLVEQKELLSRQKEEKKRAKHEEDIQFEKDCKCAQEALAEQEKEERHKKEEFRGILQSQIAESHARRLREYEDVLRDRDDMQSLLRRLEAERAADQKTVLASKEMAKEEMKEFVRSQELFKLKLRAQKVDENERHLEIMRERDETQRRVEAEKQQERKQKQLLSEKIGQQLFNIENEKRRRRDLLLDLLVEERKAKEDLRFRQNLEKQAKERIQVRLDLEHYRTDIVRLKQERQLEEDERMRVEQERIMAEQDKLHQLSDQRRRQKVQEHRRAIQEMIEEKRRQRTLEATEKLEKHKLDLCDQRKKEEEIEDERSRILRNQPADILRYLPTGVLRKGEFLALPANKENK